MRIRKEDFSDGEEIPPFLPALTPRCRDTLSRDTAMTEADVGARCDELAEGLGWKVERYEQQRVTRIHEGLPDRRYIQPARGHRVWVELKAPKGKLTSDQHRWIRAELSAGGMAIAVDSPDVLRRIFSLLSRDAGRGEAHRVCGEITELVAQRGYRDAAEIRRKGRT